MATLPHENLVRDVTTSCVYNACCNDIKISDTTSLETIFSVLHMNVHERQSIKVGENKTKRGKYNLTSIAYGPILPDSGATDQDNRLHDALNGFHAVQGK